MSTGLILFPMIQDELAGAGSIAIIKRARATVEVLRDPVDLRPAALAGVLAKRLEQAVGHAAAPGLGGNIHVVEETDLAAAEGIGAGADMDDPDCITAGITGKVSLENMTGIQQPAPDGIGDGVVHGDLVEFRVGLEQRPPRLFIGFDEGLYKEVGH